MTTRSRQTSAATVRAVVRHLKAFGSPGHAAGVQRFFKEQVRSHGWYTADLRRYARTLHGQLAAPGGGRIADSQKGLGWLLREWAKHDPAAAVPVLMAIRERAPRLVLRTGCETLGPVLRARILSG